MPQFSPVYWINQLTWLFAIVSFVIWFHQTISFPNTLRIQVARTFVLFLGHLQVLYAQSPLTAVNWRRDPGTLEM